MDPSRQDRRCSPGSPRSMIGAPTVASADTCTASSTGLDENHVWTDDFDSEHTHDGGPVPPPTVLDVRRARSL